MRKILLIANPKSGTKSNKDILNIAKKAFKENNIKITLINTEYAGHALDIVRTCNYNDYSSICAVGGDGTLNEILNGMLTRDDERKIPIGMIPGGTGNSFMKSLGSLDLAKALMDIIKNEPSLVDVIKVNAYDKIYFSINLIGWGMATDISVVAEKLRIFGGQRYNIASIYEIIKNKERTARFIIDDEEMTQDFSFIIACNTKYIGKGMKMAPKALIDDGFIDIIIVKKNSRLTLLSVFPKLFNGSHIDHPSCDYRKAKSFSIIPNENDLLNIDGEIMGIAPVNIEVLHKHIQILNLSI